MTNFSIPTDQSQKFTTYVAALAGPVAVAILAALIVFYFAQAATVTPPDEHEATRIMLQRRCAVQVEVMTTVMEDPYTGKQVEMLRAICAQPKQPEVIND